MIKNILNKVPGLVSGLKQSYTERGLDKRVNQMASTALEAGGVAVDVVKERLDSVSGQKMYDLVQEHLAVQSQYNDLLASKVHEALQRIEVLEQDKGKNR